MDKRVDIPINVVKEQDYSKMKESDIAWAEKPEDLNEPSWYFQWGGTWRFYIGFTFRRLVLNVGTPWFDFGYAF